MFRPALRRRHSIGGARRARRCAVEPLESRTLLSAGQLDSTFGQSGALVLNPALVSEGAANSVALQGDGNIVVAGGFFGGALARYRPDGTTDTSFGSNGVSRTIFPNDGEGTWESIAIQPDGKIVAGGWYFDVDHQVNAIARFNPDGSPDRTFAAGGAKTIDFPHGPTGLISSVAIDPTTGAIVFAGTTLSPAGKPVMGFARFNADGTPDATFGTNGITRYSVIDAGKPESSVTSMAILSDGRIVGGGIASNESGDSDFAFVRLTSNGSPDGSFNGTGQAVVDFFGGADQLRSIGIGPDNTITGAGYAAIPQNGNPDLSNARRYAVAQLTASGTLDTGFAGGGKITDSTKVGEWYGIKVLSDGRVLAVGSNEAETEWTATRYLSNGAPDPTFGQAGTFTRDFGSASNFLVAAAIQVDGRIVLAGERIYDDALGGSISDITLTRLSSDGSTDTSFGPDGLTQGRWPGFFGSISAVATQFDGKVICVGTFAELQSTGAPQNAAGREVVRFNVDGTLDRSFGLNGVAILPANSRIGFPHAIHAVTVLPDGAILVGGTANLSDTVDAVGDFYVARLLPDGRADTDFGGGGAALVDLGGAEDATAIAVGPDGSIVLAGIVQPGTTPINEFIASDVGVARLTAAGRLDTNFNGTGTATHDFGEDEDVVGVALDGSGNVLVAFNGGVQGGTFTPYVTKFTAAGALDGSYGTAGPTGNRAAAGPANATVRAIAALSDGSAITAGGSGGAFFVNKLTPSGAQDPTFGNGVSVRFGGPTEATALSLQRDGKIVAAGSVIAGPSRSIGIARLTADGKPDSSYGTAGKVTTARSEGPSLENVGLSVDPQGRAVVASAIHLVEQDQDFPIVMRYEGDNAPGSVAGTVYVDANRNGVRDTGEAPLPGSTVFIDSNDNGQPDAGEFVATSGADGRYTISNLPLGSYHVRAVDQDGFVRSQPAGVYPQGFHQLTAAAGQVIDGKDFGFFQAVGSPTPTSPSLSTLVASSLPTAVIGGQKIKGTVTVAVTNQTNAIVSGKVKVDLFVSLDSNLDSADSAMGSLTRSVKLKPGKVSALKVNIKALPVVTDGSYTIVAQIHAPDGGSGIAVAEKPVTITSPVVDLSSISIEPASTSLRPGARTSALLVLQNNGNLSADGSAKVTLRAVGDAGDQQIAVLPVRLKANPTKFQRISLRFALPAGLPAGTYHLIASLDAAALGDHNAVNDPATSVTTISI